MQPPKPITFFVVGIVTVGLIGAHTLIQSHINTPSQAPAPAPEQQLQKVVQPNAFFYSGVVANRSQTQVSINYSMADFPHVMLLDLVVSEGSENISRLITHPLLTTLDWEYVESNGVRLYQKTKTFNSLSAFSSNPPPGRTILADEALLLINSYKTLQAKPLNEFANLDGIDYILTTYSPSQPLGTGHRYQTVLDATSALVNLKNELVWHIRIPTATQEHPLYLGGVEVNYQ
jgi:hypothetical protein